MNAGVVKNRASSVENIESWNRDEIIKPKKKTTIKKKNVNSIAVRTEPAILKEDKIFPLRLLYSLIE
jgi:hypothetical protein